MRYLTPRPEATVNTMTSTREENYYRATADSFREGKKLHGDLETDVCILGAGFTGLSAALDLAQAGYRVAVLEEHTVGFGASGRNGGQICTGYNGGMASLEKRLGKPEAKIAWEIADSAIDLIQERVDEHQIECDLTWGYLHVAAKNRQLRGLAEHRDEFAQYGYEGLALLNKQDLSERLGSPTYVGGLWEPRAGHMHPLNFCLGLARAAEEAGADIFEHTRIDSVDTAGAPIAYTKSGTVRAKYMIIGGNAYLGQTIPKLAQKLMPVGSYILGTEPLGENRAKALIRDNDAVCDSNNIVNYYRLSADKRLLFGGRATYSGRDPKDLYGFMKPRMTKVFPHLDDVRLDFCWGGYIGITVDRTPHVGRLGPNTLFAQGYSGQGVALSGMCGRLMAQAIRGQAERFDVLTRLEHAPFPFGFLRTPALVLAMLSYRLADELP